MVLSQRRAALEFFAAAVIGLLTGVIAHGYVFLGVESDALLSAIAGVLALVIVAGLFSLRNTAITKLIIRRRYGVRLTLNEVSFLLRRSDHGHGVITNAANPAGIWLTEPLRAAWTLRTQQGEVTRIA